VLPCELPVNTVCQTDGIVVKDVFGQHSLVRPAIEDPESKWQDFAMFHQTERDNATRNQSIFHLVPAVTTTPRGAPDEFRVARSRHRQAAVLAL